MDIETIFDKEKSTVEKMEAAASIALSFFGLLGYADNVNDAGKIARNAEKSAIKKSGNMADVGKTVQSPARVVTKHASDVADAKSAEKALKGCFVAGTQVVIGNEEIVALHATAESINIYHIGAGIVMAGTAVFMGHRRKQVESDRKLLSHKKEATEPKNTSSDHVGHSEKVEVLPKTLVCEHKPSSAHQGRKFFYTASSLICLMLMLAFFWMAWPQNGKTVSADSASPSGSRYLTKNIEDVRIGRRVTGMNPDREEVGVLAPDPDQATSKLLAMVMEKDDGSLLNIQLIRSDQWLHDAGAEVGGEIFLDMPEMSAQGFARILAIDSCPPIEQGEGNVVTGTFHHESASIIDLQIAGVEPIGCTSGHLFWSVDRQEFIPAGHLQQGEQVQLHNGKTSHVVSLTQRSHSEPVYNIEVHNEHVYEITFQGVLVHNNSAASAIPTSLGTYVPRSDGLKHALSIEHVKTAKIEKAGGITAVKPNGLPFDHLTETRQAMISAKKGIEQAKRHLADPNLSQLEREIVQKDLGVLSKLLERARNILGE